MHCRCTFGAACATWSRASESANGKNMKITNYVLFNIKMVNLTCGIDSPSMMAQKPNRLPRAVLVSTATWIHLLSVSARSRSSWQVRIVTATSSLMHSVRSIKSSRNWRPCSSVISSRPVQLSGLSCRDSSFSGRWAGNVKI